MRSILMSISRRQFVAGCSTAITAMAGGRIGELVFAAEPQGDATYTTYLPMVMTPDQIFVMVFLRGGCDSLSLVSPYDDAIYYAKRGGATGDTLVVKSPLAIAPNNAAFGATSSFGLHPNAAPLKELYDAGNLAIVHATGLNDDTRSHFDAMDYIERGTPGNKNTTSGWLARHIQLIGESTALLPTISAGSAAPNALLDYSGGVVMTDLNSYGLSGPYSYNSTSNPAMLNALNAMYTGSGAFVGAGQRALEVINAIQSLKNANGGKDLTYTPEANVTYESNTLSNSLKMLAQIIKLNMGLRIATVDFGGWDTHDNQGTNGNGYYARQVDTLSRALHAFYNDLPNHRNRVTVVVMSEFGRRLGKNGGGGTDHGHGGAMFVLGGHVNGGKMYGAWPGLADLDQKQDLKITTDYRAVLGEVLAQRLGNARLGKVFPGLQVESGGVLGYKRLGIIPGGDAVIDFSA
ncbi:DUF1501 domain-containing protein [Chloroflexia bacterium SDU3-3]|nr:DUF1501 domain-containing protein [Chloroflexia bacterium SDU3-3]